jgi:CubicO group peptidase (beta-lactamase class C family)
MRFHSWAFAALVALAIPAAAQSPAELQPMLKPATAAPSPAPIPDEGGAAAPQLTKADVDAWLDGFMPYALKAGAIPGAVVVVVKDGRPLTMRGFGYSDVKKSKPVDPNLTLFRPGSVSKLFTWTAVMQQVQAGKLDLDKDVNTYLDFKIPPRDGKPITLRDLMTHTGGFAETVKGLIKFGNQAPPPLGKLLSNPIPDRIYAPGTMPAYSNYGASLAGYLVERVSGEPFDLYVQRHVLAPIGMTHSTFVQPLPANLQPLMSKSYQPGSDEPQLYEIIPMSPAGGLAASGSDMAKFMIAHLANGGPLINARTAALMHTPQKNAFSALPGMALGFYHEDRNGLDIIGHGGDTNFFHSDLHLFLGKNVGLFISMNSSGKNSAVHPLREQLFEEFTDRYFPVQARALPATATAKEHGAALSGHYVSSRAGAFSFLRLVALLGETTVGVDKDGLLTVSSLTDASTTPRRWREVAPWIWQDVNATDKLQAITDANGKVRMFSITPYAAIIEFLPAPFALNSGWILPLAGLALIILLIAALGWPTVALIRRRYKYVHGSQGRDLLLHRVTRGTAWLYLVIAVGWMAVLSLLQSDLSLLDKPLDVWLRLLQLVLVAAIVGTLVAIWNAYRIAKMPGRHRFVTIWAVTIALAAAFMAWFAVNAGLLTASLNY